MSVKSCFLSVDWRISEGLKDIFFVILFVVFLWMEKGGGEFLFFGDYTGDSKLKALNKLIGQSVNFRLFLKT